jgi:hypothetical protein
MEIVYIVFNVHPLRGCVVVFMMTFGYSYLRLVCGCYLRVWCRGISRMPGKNWKVN